jgi:hypothetical protein
MGERKGTSSQTRCLLALAVAIVVTSGIVLELGGPLLGGW